MSARELIRSYLARRLRVPEIPVALERMAALGFRPDLIFDVGAHQGDFTRLCRRIWNGSHIVAVEPLEEPVRKLRALAKGDTRIDVYECLLGARCLTGIELNVRETASSVLTEHVDRQGAVRQYPMRTIDDIVEAAGYPWPSLIKLDVQGYELEVLKGAEQAVSRAQAILAEVNLLDIHERVPLMADILAWLNERGWVAYDVCGLTRRPLDDALWQADIIFTKVGSPFRTDKRWSR